MTDELTDETGDLQTAAQLSPVRYAGLIGIGGGVVAGFASSFIPMSAIEGFVSAYGIAELLPAAAPPLGNTARLALSAGIGTLTAGALFALLPRRETNDMGSEAGFATGNAELGMQDEAEWAGKPTPSSAGFAGPRLGGWLRGLRFGKPEAAEGEITDFADLNRKRLRMADHHPDAPVRAPIFASSDLAEPLDVPVAARSIATPLPAQDEIEDAQQVAPFDLAEDMAVAAEDAAAEFMALSTRFAPPLTQAEVREDSTAPLRPFDTVRQAALTQPREVEAGASQAPREPLAATAGSAAPATDDLTQLSIADLIGRLESGLDRRKAQAVGAMASAADSGLSDTRHIRLAQVGSATASGKEREPADAADATLPETSQRFPLRLDRAETDILAEATGFTASDNRLASFGYHDTWNGEIEYQQPSVGSTSTPIEPTWVASEPVIKQHSSPTPNVEPVSMTQPRAADDMDAALRDALATLRQLSDRQRNV